jgi:hypothetical protein
MFFSLVCETASDRGHPDAALVRVKLEELAEGLISVALLINLYDAAFIADSD